MFFLLLFIVIAIIIITNIYTVPQNCAYIINRCGVFHKVAKPGLYIKAPFIDTIYDKITPEPRVKESIIQPFITKDNKMLKMVPVFTYVVTNVDLFTRNNPKSISLIEKAVVSFIREEIGEMDSLSINRGLQVDYSIIELRLNPFVKNLGAEIQNITCYEE